jgi:hypothetical protein
MITPITGEELRAYRERYGCGLVEAKRALTKQRLVKAIDQLEHAGDTFDADVRDILKTMLPLL